jgi:CheY-like chemotaxis protein
MTEPVRILMVDDEQDFLDTVGFWLTSKGHRVTAVTSGPKAVELLQQDRHDVVFLDVVMPECDGIETLRRIRAFDKQIPVIMVTTHVTDENKFAGAKALGISGLFLKGSSLEQLGKILEVSLRMIRKSKQAAPGSASGASRPSPLEPLLAFLRSLREKLTPRTR